MNNTVRKLLVGAALSGFVAGTSVVSYAAKGPSAATAGKKTTKTKVAKHCCAGMNSCKGQGGCGSTKGKNDCKGKGECSTKSSCKGQGPCASK